MKKDKTLEEILVDNGFDAYEGKAFLSCVNQVREKQVNPDVDVDGYILEKVKDVADYVLQKN